MQRADSDALYHLYRTRLANVCDLQVAVARHLDANAAGGGGSGGGGSGSDGSTRRGAGPSAGRLPGLAMALSACPSLQGLHGEALATLKKACHALFVPERGGSYDVWKQRPLPPAIVEYAAADVAHLHSMRSAWGDAVSAEEMREITSRRLSSAISGAVVPKGPHMAMRDF